MSSEQDQEDRGCALRTRRLLASTTMRAAMPYGVTTDRKCDAHARGHLFRRWERRRRRLPQAGTSGA